MISIGDIIRDIAREEGLAPNWSNLHKISEKYVAKFGAQYFSRQVIQKIEQERWQSVSVSGVRTPEDVRVFTEHFGADFILTYVEVNDPLSRFNRMKERGHTRDPKSIEEFLARDRKETELFNLHESISMATMMIMNNGSLDEFYAAIDTFVSQVGIG